MTTAQPDAKKPRRTPLYTFARGVAWVLFHTVIPIRYHNAEKLNRADAPYILIANHLSFIDPGVAAVPIKRYEVNFVGKKELTKSKLLGWLLKKLHMIVVDRHHSDMEAMRTFMKTLRNRDILALFPEGTRHHKGIMEEMESGIGLIALRSNVPVYPVYIDRRVLPFRVTHCWVGDPIPYDDIRADGVNSETSARFMARITETYRQMMADAARR